MTTSRRTPPRPRDSRVAARLFLLSPVLSALLLQGCATARPPAAPVVSFGQKMSWMLRLEDQRVLRDPTPPAPPAPATGKRRAAVPPPLPPPDLVTLLSDPEARVRRRAALAMGRVGVPDAVAPLTKALATDAEPEVRQMAAFALGLLGQEGGVLPLRAALADASPIVQGRAAEALSVLGDASSAPAIGALVAAQVKAGALAQVAPDDDDEAHPAPVEAFRLGVLALGRLKAYDALAAAVLDGTGQPLVRWWPVASAFQRTEDRRALGVLLAFARGEGRYARAFAAKGLGALKDPAAVDALVALAQAWPDDTRSAISAVRALGQIGDGRAGPALVKLLQTRNLDPLLFLEVVGAAGAVRATAAHDLLLDLLSHPSPAVRAAALRSVREVDAQGFTIVLSGLDPDRDWSVRAALASILSTLEPGAALPRLRAMLKDADLRVIPRVLAALRAVRAPGIEKTLLEWLRHDDPIVRAAAATELGELKPAGGDTALVEAWRLAARDGTYVARGAILAALVKYGRAAAEPALKEALADKDFAVRVRAASLLAGLAPGTRAAADIRPAPTRQAADFYTLPRLVDPGVSPHAFIDTARGTVEIELAVLDAPITCATFTALAAQGFFDGLLVHRVVPNFVVQDGDPRGDGEGGPGFTIRDEFSERPFLRGTVGLALDWPETGGSQFFITHSPQPHLDGRYTVFGRVVAGMEVVDRLQQWDAIEQVRVWDGKTMTGGKAGREN
jgi:cyclophilin family peptidyl-prolyl cis-trans isomerase/HEAT repeat protein